MREWIARYANTGYGTQDVTSLRWVPAPDWLVLYLTDQNSRDQQVLPEIDSHVSHRQHARVRILR